eukprot:NODE_143_length_15882_cov_1.296585.p6 type:complete len:328 gc:universal NODE_143_length_15882_cov_1.296585:4483-5466(+)
MILFLSILIATRQCIVGAGPAGVILSWELSKAFPDHEITLIDEYFNGGNLYKVKNELSNSPYSDYISLAKQLRLNEHIRHLPTYKRFLRQNNEKSDACPKLGELVRFIKDLTNYMAKSNKINTFKDRVISIDIMNHENRQFKLNFAKSNSILCDYVHMTIGGVPRPFFEMNGNPQQFNMYQALDLLNSKKSKQQLKDKTVYIVGNGDTSKWMQQKLNAIDKPFKIVRGRIYDNGDDLIEKVSLDQFRAKIMNENDTVFYAHGLESASLPQVIEQGKTLVLQKGMIYGISVYITDNKIAAFYGMGAINQHTGIRVMGNRALLLIEQLD